MTTETEITIVEGQDGVDVSFTTNVPPELWCNPDNGPCHIAIVAVVETDDETMCAGNFDGIVIPQVSTSWIFIYSVNDHHLLIPCTYAL